VKNCFTVKKVFLSSTILFIKADPHRLAIQLEMLKTAVSRGWQVLYFSAKGEVKEALQKEINRGLVKLFTVS